VVLQGVRLRHVNPVVMTNDDITQAHSDIWAIVATRDVIL